MPTLTVTAKGQITLKREVLQHLGIRPGAKLSVHMLPNHIIRIEAARPTSKISDIFGILRRDGQPVLSVEDMNAAIAEGWASKS